MRQRLIVTASTTLLVVASPALAQHEDHGREHGQDALAVETATLPASLAAVARRLWSDLVCLCGECSRLSLAACPCPAAKAERDKVLEAIAGYQQAHALTENEVQRRFLQRRLQELRS